RIRVMQTQQAALQAQQDGISTGPGGNGSSNGVGDGGGHRSPKGIHPKRILRMAQSSEIAQLVSKKQDEMKVMMICQTKDR
ncbi:hypothetical protein BGZ65_005339, partial [Modicella reniformis]